MGDKKKNRSISDCKSPFFESSSKKEKKRTDRFRIANCKSPFFESSSKRKKKEPIDFGLQIANHRFSKVPPKRKKKEPIDYSNCILHLQIAVFRKFFQKGKRKA